MGHASAPGLSEPNLLSLSYGGEAHSLSKAYVVAARFRAAGALWRLIHASFPARRDELGACSGPPARRYGPVLFGRMRSADAFANVHPSRRAAGDCARLRTGGTVFGRLGPLTGISTKTHRSVTTATTAL